MFPIRLLIIAALAHLPILFVYSRTMWTKGHYQFFPLLFGAVAWLLYDRLSKHEHDGKGGALALSLFLFNMVVLFLAVAVHTPVLVIPAVMLLLSAIAVDRYGVSGLWLAAPAIGILIIVAKLPTGRDLVLINQMQFLASQLASWILDAFGLIHFREGVILITEKKQFFTEEACSGIRSLFSTLAAVAIFGLSRNYSIPRQIFNLAQSILWVIVGNAIRVASVVYLSDNGYEQFAHGTLHDIFGLVIFVGIFGLVLSVDRAINVLFPQLKVEDDEDLAVPEEPKPAPELRSKSPIASWGLIAAYILIFLFSARLTYAKRNSFDQIAFKSVDVVAVDQTALPTQIENWVFKDFKSETRDEASLFAPESYVWTYQSNGITAIVSLDGPYPEFHDLTLCYRGVGWSVSTHHEYPEESPTGMSWLEMRKPSEYGRVFYSAYSRDGLLARPAFEFSASTRLVRNIDLAIGRLEAPSQDVNRNDELLPISQVQVLVQSDQLISDAELENCKKLFEFSRGMLLKSARFSEAPKP